MLAIDSTHDQAFLSDLHAARLHALGVLRSILNLATLSPEARAEFLKTGRTTLALLRESRLAAVQILNLQLPLPEGGGRGVGSSNAQIPATSATPSRTTPSPREQPASQRVPTPTTSPAAHLDVNPRHPVPQPPTTHRATGSPPPPRQPVREHQNTHISPYTHNTPLLHHAAHTQAAQLRARAGAAP